MIEVNVNDQADTRTRVCNLDEGEVGRAIDGKYILRTYSGAVSLNDPGETWSSTAGPAVVRLGKPKTITLTF